MPEPLCPFNDGRHKRQPWSAKGRSGLVCIACHKTWEFVGKELVATWDMMSPPPSFIQAEMER